MRHERSSSTKGPLKICYNYTRDKPAVLCDTQLKPSSKLTSFEKLTRMSTQENMTFLTEKKP